MKYFLEMPSPVGKLLLVADDSALTAIIFEDEIRQWLDAHDATERLSHPILKSARKQLEEYFAGKRKEFDLPLSPGGTVFQQRVWKALQQIGYGKTCSYGEIARQIRNAKAVRAVGAANGANPLPVVIPCHRVIGGDGSLTGYGGGLDRKRRLLAIEANA